MQAVRHDVPIQLEADRHDRERGAWQSLLALGVALGLLLAAGCATLTIPTFDPSGNRVFSSNPTQLTLPHHGPNGHGLFPKPSFAEPPPPAACVKAPPPKAAPRPTVQAMGAKAQEERGRTGEILLTPTRIVAPVGGEVVLLAGLCGQDGYLVTDEAIEWMLAPDSVGEIVEVGDDLKGKRPTMWKTSGKPTVEKLDVDYARGRTSSVPGRLTRGSSRQTDDLIIRKGQTWVSLTSPTEGLSRVTVLAPDSDIWDRRRQTATIYWVDASWQFPGPQSVRVGESATLVTQVKQAEGFAPAEGWIVKYRLATEGIGQFLSTNPNIIGGVDVRVDADGKAITQLANPANRPGTAVVTIEVARPAKGTENMPELPIARGQTMITWSAPLLELKVTGSDTTTVNQPVDYLISLANPGDLPAENVKLVMDLKNASLQAAYLRSEPTDRSNLGATWNIGVIPARQVFEAVVRIQPTQEGDHRIEFSGSASPNLRETATMPLLAVRPQLELKFAPAEGSAQAEVGQAVVFDVIATNTGRQTLSNLTLLIDSDPALQHAETGGNRVSLAIPYLPAGQTQRVGVRYLVRKAGELSAKLVAQVNNVNIAESSSFVRGVEPVPRLPAMSVQLVPQNNKTSLAPNEEIRVSALVQNRGQVRLTNILTTIDYESSLALTQAGAGVDHRLPTRTAQWLIPVLEPGQQFSVETAFRAVALSPRPAVRITAKSAEGTSDQGTLNFDLNADAATEPPVLPYPSGDASVLPPAGSAGPAGDATGGADPWSLQIQPLDQQLTVGQRARWVVSFRNNKGQPDQNVVIRLGIPAGSQVVSVNAADGTPINKAYSDDGRQLELEPIRSLRAGETVQLSMELQLSIPGAQIVEASISSAADPRGTRREARVDVRPNLGGGGQLRSGNLIAVPGK
jgi:hypothetical protein